MKIIMKYLCLSDKDDTGRNLLNKYNDSEGNDSKYCFNNLLIEPYSLHISTTFSIFQMRELLQV